MLTIIEKTPAQIFSQQLVHLKYIQLIEGDLRQLADLVRADDGGERGPGRVIKLEKKIMFLTQSYIVHLVAAWQAFVIELVQFGFRRVANENFDSPLAKLAEQPLNAVLQRFNTPGPEQIDRLFREALGLDKMTDCWNCKSFSKDQAVKRLKLLLKTRHEIAHSARSSTSLTISENFEVMEVLFDMAQLLENALIERLRTAYHK